MYTIEAMAMLVEMITALGPNDPAGIDAHVAAAYRPPKKGAAGLRGEESLKERLTTGR